MGDCAQGAKGATPEQRSQDTGGGSSCADQGAGRDKRGGGSDGLSDGRFCGD